MTANKSTGFLFNLGCMIVFVKMSIRHSAFSIEPADPFPENNFLAVQPARIIALRAGSNSARQ